MRNFLGGGIKEISEEAEKAFDYRDKGDNDKYMFHKRKLDELIDEYTGKYEVDNKNFKEMDLQELLEESLEEIKQIDISKDAGNMLRAGIHSKRATSLIEECISRVPNKKVG